MEKKCTKAKWLSGEGLQIAVKRREAKSKGAKERYKAPSQCRDTQGDAGQHCDACPCSWALSPFPAQTAGSTAGHPALSASMMAGNSPASGSALGNTALRLCWEPPASSPTAGGSDSPGRQITGPVPRPREGDT